ncbi:MAG: hypothetical protein ACJ72P_03005, partial [Nocardioides sp.]
MTDQHTVGDRTTEGAQAPSWVQVSYGVPTRDRGPERTGRVLGWVSLAAVIALIGVAIASLLLARDLAEKEAAKDAAIRGDLLGQSVIEPKLRLGLLESDPNAIRAQRAREALDTVV